MAVQRTPFTDSAIQREVITNMIRSIDRAQVPLLQELGWENEKSKFKDFVNWPPGGAKTITWTMDTLPPRTDALDGAIDASQTTIVVDNGTYWHQGHVLRIDSEDMIVEDQTNNTLTVARAQGGTTGAAHVDNSVITMVGIAKRTGQNYSLGYTTTVTTGYNYMQFMEESVQVNDDQQMAKDWGVEDTMAYHLAKLIGGNSEIGPKGRAGHMTILLANIAYYGNRQQPSNTVGGMAGGLGTFITTNLTGDTSTALSRTQIETQLRAVFNSGTAVPDLLVTSAWGATKITQMFEGLIQTERGEETGGSTIKYIETPVVPRIKILVDPFCPTTKTYILDSTRVGWVCTKPFQVREMPTLGYYDVNSVAGEYSFVVTNEKAHAIITHSSTL